MTNKENLNTHEEEPCEQIYEKFLDDIINEALQMVNQPKTTTTIVRQILSHQQGDGSIPQEKMNELQQSTTKEKRKEQKIINALKILFPDLFSVYPIDRPNIKFIFKEITSLLDNKITEDRNDKITEDRNDKITEDRNEEDIIYNPKRAVNIMKELNTRIAEAKAKYDVPWWNYNLRSHLPSDLLQDIKIWLQLGEEVQLIPTSELLCWLKDLLEDKQGEVYTNYTKEQERQKLLSVFENSQEFRKKVGKKIEEAISKSLPDVWELANGDLDTAIHILLERGNYLFSWWDLIDKKGNKLEKEVDRCIFALYQLSAKHYQCPIEILHEILKEIFGKDVSLLGSEVNNTQHIQTLQKDLEEKLKSIINDMKDDDISSQALRELKSYFHNFGNLQSAMSEYIRERLLHSNNERNEP